MSSLCFSMNDAEPQIASHGVTEENKMLKLSLLAKHGGQHFLRIFLRLEIEFLIRTRFFIAFIFYLFLFRKERIFFFLIKMGMVEAFLQHQLPQESINHLNTRTIQFFITSIILLLNNTSIWTTKEVYTCLRLSGQCYRPCICKLYISYQGHTQVS